MPKKFLVCFGLVFALIFSGCSATGNGDLPVSHTTVYSNQPQGTLSVFDNSFAIAPEGSNAVFYKNISTGKLMRTDRDFQDRVSLSEGEIVGIAYEDDSLFYARLIKEGEEVVRSELVRADRNGENPQLILSTERTIRQMLIVDRLIYFVAYDEEACELWRCNLKGQSLITVAGDSYFVGDYTLCKDTVYFNMVWAEEAGDYTTYRCGISGADVTQTGFRRGGSFFFAGDTLYSAVPYGDDQVMLEILDREGEADQPYLIEEGGSMVSALWFGETHLYFALPDSRNLWRINLESRQVEELYTDEEEGWFTGIVLAAGQLVVCDSQGKQYTAKPEIGLKLIPLE